MATRFDKTKSSKHTVDGGYEGENITHNYIIPSCGLEDVDKAVFNLFDKQIPLFYESHGETKRVPVIFATGAVVSKTVKFINLEVTEPVPSVAITFQ